MAYKVGDIVKTNGGGFHNVEHVGKIVEVMGQSGYHILAAGHPSPLYYRADEVLGLFAEGTVSVGPRYLVLRDGYTAETFASRAALGEYVAKEYRRGVDTRDMRVYELGEPRLVLANLRISLKGETQKPKAKPAKKRGRPKGSKNKK